MPGAIQGKTQPWFTINEHLSKEVSAGADVDVERITAVAFDVDVNITVGTLTSAFALPAGVALGMDSSTASFSVDVTAFMFAMGGR